MSTRSTHSNQPALYYLTFTSCPAGVSFKALCDGQGTPAFFCTVSDFTRNLSNTWTKDAIINFDMVMGDGINPSIAYDENGNILKMQQNGMKFTSAGPQSTLIDNMSYSYKNTGEVSNRLRTVTEAPATAADNKLGDFTDNNTTGDDYNYDANGNLKMDKNKRISLIEYNHLNLPWRITATDANNNTKGIITYIYDATGNKLEKRTDESPSSANANTQKVTQTSYLGGFIYENNKLQFFGHEEGRVRPIIAAADNGNQSFAFDYFLKDHLGNVRTVLTDEKVPTSIYQAGMEDANRAFEVALFGDKINTTASTKPGGFDSLVPVGSPSHSLVRWQGLRRVCVRTNR